ncbi:unnamed protein product [Microthlaspi erraticum]|uniref:Uncharacterized protein n=1 Tax=Microthlaspi erraticum TaxID=1685480 RepID=A0A6D2J5M1_9BRAS|nr:unnamed protein product [Microthlaspi erraticum]
MERGKTLDSIPIDLILEILFRASTKSVARFGLASKFCASIVRRPDFTELFLTRSSARPRLLFAIRQGSKWSFYSSPQLAPGECRSNSSSSLVAAADHQVELDGYTHPVICEPVSGLIYFHNVHIEKMNVITVPVVYNPSTGQYTSFPKRTRTTKFALRSLLGYDPVDKQFKVLSYDSGEREYHILTLGTGKEYSWRKIEFPARHSPFSEEICIDGVLYYLADVVYRYSPEPSVSRVSIACFDVRSEKIRFLDASMFLKPSRRPYTLINYKGELGVIGSTWHGFDRDGNHTIEFKLWVLKDVQKNSWSKSVFSARPEEVSFPCALLSLERLRQVKFFFRWTVQPHPSMFSTSVRRETLPRELKSEVLKRLRILAKFTRL